jgi:hypothetical protein
MDDIFAQNDKNRNFSWNTNKMFLPLQELKISK